MTQTELNTFYQTYINGKNASQLAQEIYAMTGQSVTGGIVKHFNDSVAGRDVKDDITRLTMLLRAYNDLVQAAASKVPADVSSRLTSIESLVAELEAMGVANSPDARGDYSHSEGSNTEAYGAFSHAEGLQTEATGRSSHAEGISSEATKDAAHAEGEKTTASGLNSHAEGYLSKATGHYSHAEGSSTTASGGSSHAEGNTTTASGVSSHAEGSSTVASGNNSHAEGSGTIASANNQHVQGKFNADDANAAFIIGNGNDASHRKNAVSIDWSGNAKFAGKVYSANKELATKEYVDSKTQGYEYEETSSGGETTRTINLGADVVNIANVQAYQIDASILNVLGEAYKLVIRGGQFVELPIATEEYAMMLHIIGSDSKHYGGVLKCVNGKPVFEYDEIT